MKKGLTLFVCVFLLFGLAACGENRTPSTEAVKTEEAATKDPGTDKPAESLPEIADKTDKVQFAAYSFKVNGRTVTNADLAGLHIYKISVKTVNSKGTPGEATYCGYRLADVLKACGIEKAAKVTAIADDGYTSELDASWIGSEYTLVAIEKDKETGKGGTIWLAPCSETVSGSYCKLVVEIKAE